MPNTPPWSAATVARDLTAGLVVFLVALPLCLGIALASQWREAPEGFSNVTLASGLLAGIVGGILVGIISGSQTSVAGPAAGLVAVVVGQVKELGSFDTFLLAVMIAGLIQIGLGLIRAGFLAAFFPSAVIKGLLAAIGILLILKNIPHLVGHDKDSIGEMALFQPDGETTFSELVETGSELVGMLFHWGALTIGLLSLGLLILWDRIKSLKSSVIPAPLVVVAFGVAMDILFGWIGRPWDIEPSHLVQVPVAESWAEFVPLYLQFPDFSQWANPKVYWAGITIAIVASLETLLNLNAVDKIDPLKRVSPPNRELLAQGIGNTILGLIGGLPMTSVIVRSSVNINAGAQTRLSAITHGVLLVTAVILLPTYINMIPLSCLAAILLATGIKLASPALVKQMWNEGRYQFAPFIITVLAIVFTDLLIGTLVGLGVALSFILYSNQRRPIRRVIEKHLGGDVLHIELASQVSFLNRAALESTLREAPRGSQVLIDATHTVYIDPDVLDLIRDFKETVAPVHGVQVSLLGFRDKYQIKDEIQYVDYSTRELQDLLTSEQVLEILKEGNERVRTGRRLTRDLTRQIDATSTGQHPLAVVLSCIDSRSPAELIFDLGLGDIFSVRVAGNIISPGALGSMEYGCAVAGAKLILVVGHTRCGAVTAAVDLLCAGTTAEQATGCQHLETIISQIQQSIDLPTCQRVPHMPVEEKVAFVDDVARRNVIRVVHSILEQSNTIRELVRSGRISVVGALYDIASGKIDVLERTAADSGIVERASNLHA